MKFVDIHAHLESIRFEADLDEVVKRAEQAGIKMIVNSGVNPETNRKALALGKKYSLIKASFGFYPFDVLAFEIKNSQEFLRNLEEYDLDEEIRWVEKNKDSCVAIGECGLDFSIELTDTQKETQRQAFRKVIQLAKKINKPVLVHSRKAEEECIKILEEEAGLSHPPALNKDEFINSKSNLNNSVKNKNISVIMHCFSGGKKLIKRVADNGWYFSIPPVIKRLLHFQMLVEMVPIEQLLTETDSPYLSPVAGERNEPKNVEATIEEIARIKNLSREEVAKKIFENTERVLDLKLS